MKIALVHDHLIQNGGAERVLSALQSMWPNAPTYTLAYDKPHMAPEFGHRIIRTSFLNRLPGGHKKLRWYLPFMPTATESYDLSEFDVIISSSSAFAKGVITSPSSIHICYCHTPTRYLWEDTLSYIGELRVPRPVKRMLPLLITWLRMWDKLASDRVDHFIANSETVARRITKYYRRDSTVIFPPVDIDRFAISDGRKQYYLVGGRIVDYKRFDIVVTAFTRLGIPLKVFGSGPAEKALRRMAGPNIEFLGRVGDDERAHLYANAIAFIHPHEEDFGITAIESMASGRPVIALRKGGATETVEDGVTGVFFDEQSWEELADTVLHFDETRFSPHTIREHAARYSTALFRESMRTFVEKLWAKQSR